MLISQKTKQFTMKAIKKAFQMNALLDRIVYVLSAKFAMVQASDKLHLELAHKYPLIADKLVDPLLDFNEDIFRPSVDEESKDYSDIIDIFNTILTETINFNAMVSDAREAADETGDCNVRVAMDNIIKDFQIYIKQAIILRDKAALYNQNIAEFDRNFDTFWIM